MTRHDAIRLPFGIVLICAALLHACDGGGDGGGIGGSGITPLVNADLTYGTITGFGSVIINSQRYNTENSEFSINGQSGNQSDLAVGMIVSADVDFDDMSAFKVSYQPTVLGPVSSIDIPGNRMIVLGQTIIVGANTESSDVSLAELNPSDFIQLTGSRDSREALRATWLSHASRNASLQVSGTVSNLQAGRGTFSIGQLTIEYTEAEMPESEFEISNGTSIIVSAPESNYDPGTNTLSATSIDPAVLTELDSGRRLEIEGIVTSVESSNQFLLGSRSVRIDENTRIQLVGGNSVTDGAINLNTRLEVKGYVQSDGIIHATRIIVIPSDESRLLGRIESVDIVSRTVRVLGVEVAMTDRTRYDGVAGFEELGIGSYVEIDASFLDNSLVAARIEIEDPDDEASLRGPVTRLDVDTSTLEVLGISLIDNGDTEYENRSGQAVNRNDFLRGVRIGDLVEAEWDEFQSTALPPDEVEVED